MGPTLDPTMRPSLMDSVDASMEAGARLAQGEYHQIIIRRTGQRCYRINIWPPLHGEMLDTVVRSARQALKWADGVRQSRGWRIVDRTSEFQP